MLLCPRNVAHLEHAGAAAGDAGEETGPQGMGAEIGRLEAGPLRIGLCDIAHALVCEPLSAQPAALGDGPK